MKNSQYNFRMRFQDLSWSFITIENLIKQSKESKNTTLLIYAAFESRHILERIEFEAIVMSANSRFTIKDFENIKKHHGIQKANKKFNALKFKYQTFSESFSKAVGPDLKAYDYKKAEDIKGKLSQYLHIYSRTDQELEFDSSFIQSGFVEVQSAIDFLKSYMSIDNGGYYHGILDFMTIEGAIKSEFISWLNSLEQNNDELTERLIKIVNDEKIMCGNTRS